MCSEFSILNTESLEGKYLWAASISDNYFPITNSNELFPYWSIRMDALTGTNYAYNIANSYYFVYPHNMQPMPAFQQHMIKSHFLSSIYPLAEMMHWKLHMYIWLRNSILANHVKEEMCTSPPPIAS